MSDRSLLYVLRNESLSSQVFKTFSFVLVALTLTLLTGCSSDEPKYDPVDLLEYENCLDNPPEYFGAVFTPPRNWAEQACEDKRPVLK